MERARELERKGATELLEANPQYVVLNPEDAKGKWHEIFGMIIQSISKWGAKRGLYYWDGQGPEINYVGIRYS